jgi:glycosyltransferase involved in cell wall biosynthesis
MAGVARYVLDVAETGIEGWDLSFVLPEGPLADELRRLGWPTTTERFGRDVGVAKSLLALRSAIRRVGPDLIHSHLAWADVIAGWAAPAGTPVISTEHGIAEVPRLYNRTWAMATAKRVLHRRRMKRTDCLIPVSRATAEAAEHLWGPPQGPVRVIHNGVDHMGEPPASRNLGTRFGCFARLALEKDYPTMLAAFELVRPRMPEATLDIAGTGPLEGWLRSELHRRGLESAVRIRGFMEPEDFFREVAVVVQLSVWENCSYSVLDAVVRGKGVVATEVGGYLEYLPSRCLAPVGDAASAADRMIEQASDVSLRPSLPDDWPTVREMTEQLAGVYAEISGKQSRERAGHSEGQAQVPRPLAR